MKYITDEDLINLKQVWKNEEAGYWIDEIIQECAELKIESQASNLPKLA